MFKRLLLAQFLILNIFITNSFSAEKMVILDINFILNESKPAKSIIKEIESIEKKEISKLQSLEKKLKKKNEDIIKTKNLLSEEEFNKKVVEFRKELSSFDKNKKEVVNNLNKKKKLELNKLLNQITPLIQEYMKQNSIDVIIDKKNVFIVKSEHDITKEILELINKKIK
tara:strand:- start:1468 stop:1977 length:510 start_codon:yes stop_codon:yes gene_type:complete